MTFLRRAILVLLLVCLGCSAQSAPPEVARRIEQQVRSFYTIPSSVKIVLSDLKPSEFPNYDALTITFDGGEKKQTYEFLLARDGKTLLRMTKLDPMLPQIAAQFTRHDVQRSGGGYMIVDRRTSDPVARLRPIPGTDRFELFYWSNVKGRWTTFGNLGRVKLMLKSAREIVENEPMFRVPRSR